jgi:uncharacterized protein (TIGR02246 family)
MKADMQTTEEVKAALERLADAYASRDLAKFMACFAPDADVVLYGTGADEKRVGPEAIRTQVERDWAQTETAAMVFSWMSVSAAGPVAWAAVDSAFHLRASGQGIDLPARVSFVLERRAGTWQIVHAHFSVPAEGQEEGHSI